MLTNKGGRWVAFWVIAIALAVPVLGQDGQQQQNDTQASAPTHRIPAGQKEKIKGVIISRESDSLTMRDEMGRDLTVVLTNTTEVEEKKSNPFRRAKNYAVTQLLRGLVVEVQGRGDANGALVADEIKFKDDDLMVARTVESRVTPVEGRVTVTESRLSEAEQNAQRLSGQIEELQAISNAARGGAKAAQETADAALAGVQATNERISNLVTGLDEYEAKRGVTVNFKVNSARLSDEAKMTLDEIAAQAKSERGYVIEVTGFASADGSEALNRRLSQQRADAVVRYLAEEHMVPLRRIITPFGYGELQPVADNTTREGREQNRRVEVKLLVNRGLNSTPAGVTTSSTDGSASAEQPADANRSRVASSPDRP